MHHLYAVMQVSMSEHVNHTFASDTLFPSLLLPRISNFDFQSTALVQLQGFFVFSFLFHLFAVTPSNIFLVLFFFLLFRFLEDTYLRVGFLTTCLRGTPRNVISIHPHHLFFSLFDFFDSSSMRRIRAYLICGLLCFSVHRK